MRSAPKTDRSSMSVHGHFSEALVPRSLVVGKANTENNGQNKLYISRQARQAKQAQEHTTSNQWAMLQRNHTQTHAQTTTLHEYSTKHDAWMTACLVQLILQFPSPYFVPQSSAPLSSIRHEFPSRCLPQLPTMPSTHKPTERPIGRPSMLQANFP